MAELATKIASINGMGVEFLDVGEGPLVVCLHGFPDQPSTWSPLMRTLASSGRRIVAPALRGYTPANKAPDGNYREWATASDALALIAALGYERATIVGHDWGAAAAYVAAALAPERVENLVTLAVPFGPAFARAMMFDEMQRERSWYWFFFQLPFAEAAIAHNDYTLVERLWRTWSPGFVASETEMRTLKQRLAAPGVLPEILSYYRQTLSTAAAPPPDIAAKLGGKIEPRTLYLHGRADGCIGAEVGENANANFAGRYEHRVIDGVGHFLHAERPDLIAHAILAFMNPEADA